jgi:hypothetical protein
MQLEDQAEMQAGQEAGVESKRIISLRKQQIVCGGE